jgi:PhzF family phenazine biosynthesis protein
MFAPHSGVPEDPATGSASGPLGAYLVRHRDHARDIRVGGGVVAALDGRLRLP